MKNLEQLLSDLREYMQDKADVEGSFNDIDFIWVYNQEAIFLSRIDEVLEKI